MLVNIHHDSRREHDRLLVAGVVFLAAIASLIALSIAIYAKAFESATTVTIKADRAGLQLPVNGDVRVNGVLVGRVASVDQDGQEASIRLAIKPEAAKEIPGNATVQILPTTLFGQKFVSFVRPPDPQGSLREGQVIPSSRVDTNVELSRVLDQLFPLLRAVQPAQLNYTLNALATALEGRGAELGQTLEELDAYLQVIAPHLPTLREDFSTLADVAVVYDEAAPDLLQTLGNLTVTARTVTAKRGQLDAFFTDLTGLAATSTQVLGENEQGLIRVGEVTEPILKLLATYSPEYPCLLDGLATYRPKLSETFAGDKVKQYIQVPVPQYRVYDERDRPVYGEIGHGPWCAGLPNPVRSTDPSPLKDGTLQDDDPPTGIDGTDYLPGNLQSLLNGGRGRAAPSASTAPEGEQEGRGLTSELSSGLAGSDAEKQVVNALLAAETGRPADSYGALGSLLYGPAVRTGGPATTGSGS